MSATLLKNNKIIAKEDVTIRSPFGKFEIAAGTILVINNVISLSDVNLDLPRTFTIEQLPDSVILNETTLRCFDDLEEVDIENFFDHKNIKLSNRTKL